MGRTPKMQTKVQLHVLINKAVDARLRKFSEQYKLPITYIVESSIHSWLTARELEAEAKK